MPTSSATAPISAAEQIKAAGGPTITFNRVDNTSGTPEAAITAARKLVADGVPVAQTSFPEASIAIVPVIDDAKLLTFNPAGATPEQLGAGEFLWMGGPDGQAPLKLMADYVKSTDPDATSAGIIAWNTLSGINSGKDIETQWKSLGGTVTGTELVDIGSADVGPQVARVLAEGEPDVVFLVLFGPDNANVIKALRDRSLPARSSAASTTRSSRRSRAKPTRVTSRSPTDSIPGWTSRSIVSLSTASWTSTGSTRSRSPRCSTRTPG